MLPGCDTAAVAAAMSVKRKFIDPAEESASLVGFAIERFAKRRPTFEEAMERRKELTGEGDMSREEKAEQEAYKEEMRLRNKKREKKNKKRDKKDQIMMSSCCTNRSKTKSFH